MNLIRECGVRQNKQTQNKQTKENHEKTSN